MERGFDKGFPKLKGYQYKKSQKHFTQISNYPGIYIQTIAQEGAVLN